MQLNKHALAYLLNPEPEDANAARFPDASVPVDGVVLFSRTAETTPEMTTLSLSPFFIEMAKTFMPTDGTNSTLTHYPCPDVTRQENATHAQSSRTKFTAWEKQILEAYFQSDPYPDGALRAAIAALLAVDTKVITKW